MDSFLTYKEAAGKSFSFDRFLWKELTVRGAPGSIGLAGAPGAPSDAVKGQAFSGGFHYRGSALVTSPCRNRFILWHYQDGCLQLLEVSLDTNLAHNALRLRLRDAGYLLPDVCVQEIGSSHVVFLFASETSVFRLVLPHPEAVLKDAGLSAAGEGLQPSVLAFASIDSFRGSNTVAVFAKPSDAVPLTSCSSWISRSGVTFFALASPSGAISVVQLQPPDSHGLPIRSELKETSMMNRLWSSILPSAVRGGVGVAGDAPVSIATHMFSGEVIVLSLCRDLCLRLWSCQQSQVVMTHKLTDYLLHEGGSQEEIKAEKLLLRKAADATATSLRFAVYCEINHTSQISVFHLLLVDNQLILDLISTYPCPEGCVLVDFLPTNCEVWVLWRSEGGGEETKVQWATYESKPQGSWKDVILSTPASPEVTAPPHKEPMEAYLDELFHPGSFCTAAICKALELYGAGVTDGALSAQQLRQEAVQKVEEELHSSALSKELHLEEYRDLQHKCWAKFYGCCHEYQGLLSHPLGLFVDQSTGLACVLRRGMFSPLCPASGSDVLQEFPREGGVSVGRGTDAHLYEDVVVFVECVKLTADQFPAEVLDSFLADLGVHGTDPTLLAMELSSVLLYEDVQLEEFRSDLRRRLEGLGDLSAAVGEVLVAVDPSRPREEGEGEMETAADEEEEEEEGPADRELQLAISQLFAGHVAMVTIGSALQEMCLSRLQFCRDVLVLLCVMKSEGMLPGEEGEYPSLFASLVLQYHTLHWLTTRPTLPTTVSAYESNLRQLASLEISAGKNTRSPAAGTSSTLWELYYMTQGGRELRGALVAGRVLPAGVPVHRHWFEIIPRILSLLVRQLWPSTRSLNVTEFLLSNCQHMYVQEYVSQVGSYVTENQYSLQFLLGQSYLNLGELQKAQDCFVRAAGGLDDPAELLLHQITAGNEDTVSGGTVGESDRAAVIEYYIKVMRLFEQVPAPTFVLGIATIATKVASKRDPNCAILWSNLFKYHLELGHHSEAYAAIMGSPDPERRKDCLRRFIIVLTEQNKLKELCRFPYTGLEEEVEQLIQTRARSVAIKHRYYDLLYCLHSKKNNYRKAAYVMYEYGLRLGREAPGHKSLQKQASCYSTTLSCLHQVEPEYAWVVRPVELEVVQSQKSRRKRNHPLNRGSNYPRVEVLTIKDIDKEYLLIRAKLSLIQKDVSLTTQLSGPFVSVEEVVALCVQVGLFDKAISMALSFDLPLEPVFQALTARCVHLSVNVVAFRRGMGDMSTLDWLGMNTTTDTNIPRENTMADKAWLMLRTYLEEYDVPSRGHQLQRCVASKLLSMGAQLPQWMEDTYKATNPAELLRLYLTFDLLVPAAGLALEYIDAVRGHGKEFFGLETALHATSPSVWLPYSTLDHLLGLLQGARTNPVLTKLSEDLNLKLKDYVRLVASITETMEDQARLRHTHLLHTL